MIIHIRNTNRNYSDISVTANNFLSVTEKGERDPNVETQYKII